MPLRTYTCLFLFIYILFINKSFTQDTTWVSGFNYGSGTRDSLVQFPEGDHNRFAKVLMFYSMRCKDGLVSTSSERNKGCGEWDYSCNTNVIDSSRTDSLKVLHPNYIIQGLTDNFFSYTTKPTFTYYSYTQQKVVPVNTAGVTALPLVGQKGDYVLAAADKPIYKGYFLYPASSLPQGLAGTLAGIRLSHQGTGTLPFLNIAVAYTSSLTLDAAELESLSFTEVVNREVALTSGMGTDIYFHRPLSFPGATNMVLRISYQGNTDKSNEIKLLGTKEGPSATSLQAGPDRYLSLGEQGLAEVPTGGVSKVTTAISISFWSRGSGVTLPANNSLFHAVDAKGNRQLNVHLPWSNARIYWDCGNDGTGFDRIDKAAVAAEFEDIWHHWTLTKDAVAGTMKIYLDGELWHSATGKKKPISIDKMVLGTDQSGNTPYPGDLDDFCVWNRELSASEIKRAMVGHAPSDAQLKSGLVLYYSMNEPSGKQLLDESVFTQHALFNQEPVRQGFRGKDIYKEFTLAGFRPDISFLKGNATMTVTEFQVIDSVQNRSTKVVPFRVEDKKLVQGTPFYVWASGYFPVLDEEGEVINEVEFPEEEVLFIDNLVYYNYYPTKYELLSFVTPYGIGLDLGIQGKTWVFDVSDYAPILKGKKRLLMDKGGEWQEEIDIRFAYVGGTPPRNVLDIQQVWPATAYGYTSILQNQHLEPRELRYDPASVKSMKVRTVSTGHGQEGEFISRLHSMNVNGGNPEFVWPLWKECADNAVYPQGGTWVYDRAGWCPGAPSDLREFEIMSFVTQSDQFTLDYGLNTASGDSRYIVNTQLVKYGPINFGQDATIADIISPTNEAQHTRQNPFCGKPVVVLQNNGATVLTSATIKYSCGNTVFSFPWTGNLSFQKTQEVTLPELPASEFLAGNVFKVWVEKPNGQNDQNQMNDALTAHYTHPAILTGDLVVGMKTNGMAAETSWKVRNTEGVVIGSSKPNLTGFTLYQDTLRMLQGCYSLQFSDSDDDGISWWANGDGDGFIRAKGTQSNWNFFNPDFGREFTFHFYAGTIVKAEDPQSDEHMAVYPNPVSDELFVSCTGIKSRYSLALTNTSGETVFSQSYANYSSEKQIETIDMSNLPAGIYFVRFVSESRIQVLKCIKAR